jgi:hypothetical protein
MLKYHSRALSSIETGTRHGHMVSGALSTTSSHEATITKNFHIMACRAKFSVIAVLGEVIFC